MNWGAVIGTPYSDIGGLGRFAEAPRHDVAGGIRKARKVELGDDEIFQLRGHRQLARRTAIDLERKRIALECRIKLTGEGRRSAEQLARDDKLLADSRDGVGVVEQYRLGGVRRGEGIDAGNADGILTSGRGRRDLGERQSGHGVDDTEIINERRGVGDRQLERGGRDRA